MGDMPKTEPGTTRSGRRKLKYRVFFEQVNRYCYVVEGASRQAAIEKAHRMWRRDFSDQWPVTVEDASPGEEVDE